MNENLAANTVVANTTNPPKWHTVYSNDLECRFFKELSRGAYEWRTSDSIAKKIGAKVAEVESVIKKYLPQGVVQQQSTDPTKFRYWERSPSKKKKSGTIAEDGQAKRVVDAKKAQPNP